MPWVGESVCALPALPEAEAWPLAQHTVGAQETSVKSVQTLENGTPVVTVSYGGRRVSSCLPSRGTASCHPAVIALKLRKCLCAASELEVNAFSAL